MKLHICLHNSQGLINDMEILKTCACFLKESDICVSVYDEREINCYENKMFFDIQIFLEHIAPCQLQYSNCNIFIPNLEMLSNNDTKYIDDVQLLVAKTVFGEKRLRQCFPKHSGKIKYWGWTSLDRENRFITPDYNEYLHVKGQSRFKNSQLLLNLWLKHEEWPMLHIVHYGHSNQNGFLEIKQPVVINGNITLYQYKLEDSDLSNLMNRCGVHICPSATEGFGHYINEARSAGALVITTNCFPMNEFLNDNYGIKVMVKKNNIKHLNAGISCVIEENDLEDAIEKCIHLSEIEKEKQSTVGRLLYVQDRSNFKKVIKNELTSQIFI
jgi:glycosyltransferase involved in cell wall biosynthesis